MASPSPFVFVKREGDPEFAPVAIAAGDLAGQLVDNACMKFGWGPCTHVKLYLIKRSTDEDPHSAPSQEEIATAVTSLPVAMPLALAGVVQGSWVVARSAVVSGGGDPAALPKATGIVALDTLPETGQSTVGSKRARSDDAGEILVKLTVFQKQTRESLQLMQATLSRASSVPLPQFSPTSVAQSYRDLGLIHALKLIGAPTWFAPSADLSAAFSTPHALDESAPEAATQSYMERVADALVSESSSVVLCGRSSRPTFGTRKPDMPGYVAVRRDASPGTVRMLTRNIATAMPSGVSAARGPASFDSRHVVVIGELKKLRVAANAGVFSDEEKGDTLSFVQDLVSCQPWRALSDSSTPTARVVAFLCDGRHIIFFQCFLNVDVGQEIGVSFERVEETPPFVLQGDGGRYLHGLTVASLPSLGYAPPSFHLRGSPVGHVDFLGLGATACVYGGDVLGSSSVVVKQYFRGTSPETMTREAAVLEQVVGVSGLIQFLGRADSALSSPTAAASATSAIRSVAIGLAPLGSIKFSLRACLLQEPRPPAGQLFNCDSLEASLRADGTEPRTYRPGAAEYCDLVDALANLHAKGFVHRDPRPDNFFRTADGHFFLGDLGSATSIGAAAWDARPWSFPYGPLDVLRTMSQTETTSTAAASSQSVVQASAVHDFEQVARLVYATQSRVVDALPVHTSRNMSEIVAFWDSIGHLEPLCSLLAAAKDATAESDAGAVATAAASAAASSSTDARAAARERFKIQIRRALL